MILKKNYKYFLYNLEKINVVLQNWRKAADLINETCK
jgi:hypothetical protein